MPTRAELVWDGKYDAQGKRVAPLRVALPFQTVETVNETAQDRAKGLFAFREHDAQASAPWRNRLIWGDKKYVLPSLLPEFAGKVNLIYIDPPFDTGADFSFTASVPDADDNGDESIAFTKEPSLIEQKAYRDTWGRGLDSYLQWFYETVVLLHELLAPTGSIYVHLDYHVASYAKAILDEVFGKESCLSEIIWKRTSSHNDPKRPGNIHDILYYYSASDAWVWNQQYQPLDKEYVEKVYVYEDKKGRYRLGDLTAPGISKGVTGKEWRGVNPTSFGRHWRRPPEELEVILAEGGIQLKADGKPSINGWKQYLDQSKGMPIQSIWPDMPNVTGISAEKLGYPTQKPERLLQRIIKASCNEGDLVLDCFCGSGTTAAVAEKLNRRWIACDLGRFAIHTTRKRLLQIANVSPFVVQNLGKYERQLWQTGQFEPDHGDEPRGSSADEPRGSSVEERHRSYVAFILNLYHATPTTGRVWLHGVRGGRMVHVGGVDAPISVGDVKNIVAEFKKITGAGKDAPTTNGIDVLGWDFAFELNEVARQQAADANVRLSFKRIPRDVMDKRAVEQGEIKFFEMAALSVEVKTNGKKKTLTPGPSPAKPGEGRSADSPSPQRREGSNIGREVTLALTDFVIPPDDVPEEVRQAVKHWAQWIDYWAVDWNHKDDTFHNEWQTFRTRKDPKLALETKHTYEEAGEYRIVVKVIDILGNDTTKTVKVRVK